MIVVPACYHFGERIKIISIKPGEEIKTIRDLLTGERFKIILRLAKALSDQSLKKQTDIFRRITVLASPDILANLEDLRVEKLEALSAKELEALGIQSQAFASFAGLVALHLGTAEGDRNKLTESLRVSVVLQNGIFGWDRNILSALVATLQSALQAYRRILASA